MLISGAEVTDMFNLNLLCDPTMLTLTEELIETPTLDLNFLSGSTSETIETLNAQLMLELNHESAKLETDELIQTLNGEMTNDLRIVSRM